MAILVCLKRLSNVFVQAVDIQKPDSAVGVSTGDEKEGEGKPEGYWAWFTGKRRAISNDVPAKTQ